MSEMNPQIEEQLNKLADCVCQSLEGERPAFSDETAELLKALLSSGYARQDDTSLQTELEARVKDKCREPALHRGAEISSITEKLKHKFDDLVRWESKQPHRQDHREATHVGSAKNG